MLSPGLPETSGICHVLYILYRKTLCCLQVYQKLVAFVMSYSFTDEESEFLGKTMMVPFVDLLNHASKHHVELTFHPNCLKLMAIRDIAEVGGWGLLVMS